MESQLIATLLRNADWPVGLHLSSMTVPLKLFRRSQCAGNDDLKVKYGVETTYVSYFDSKRESDSCFPQLSLEQKMLKYFKDMITIIWVLLFTY